MTKVYDLTGKVILTTREIKKVEKVESDLPVLEGLVRSALFHPLEQFRNSGLLRLQEASKLGAEEGIGKVIAGFVQRDKVYVRIETKSGKIEDKYLFDVPKELYEVSPPVAYPFVISAPTNFGPNNGSIA